MSVYWLSFVVFASIIGFIIQEWWWRFGGCFWVAALSARLWAVYAVIENFLQKVSRFMMIFWILLVIEVIEVLRLTQVVGCIAGWIAVAIGRWIVCCCGFVAVVGGQKRGYCVSFVVVSASFVVVSVFLQVANTPILSCSSHFATSTAFVWCLDPAFEMCLSLLLLLLVYFEYFVQVLLLFFKNTYSTTLFSNIRISALFGIPFVGGGCSFPSEPELVGT